MFNFDKITEDTFEKSALSLFHYQANNVSVYKRYLEALEIDISSIMHSDDIPCLPISLFKTNEIIVTNKTAESTFLSSGTSQQIRSKHLIADLSLYEKSFKAAFIDFYGDINEYCIQALLPSYLENDNSSLIYMINHFINLSPNPKSAFVTEEELISNVSKLKNQKVLLIGVSYALLDLAEKGNLDLKNYTIMETGGMKGRRKEWTRSELHQVYQKAFNVSTIHSEYGMTELLSQAYSKGNGVFKSPNWLRIRTRPFNEPFSKMNIGQTGVIKVIDLANIYSCAFIETADIGKVYQDGSFEVLGRVDFEEIRGCNLMLS